MRPLALPAVFVLITAGVALASPAITTDYGVEFVTVGDVNNAPWDSGVTFDPPRNNLRGSVGYEYRMARTEITTGQWLEFVNTFTPQNDPSRFTAGVIWGAAPVIGTTTYALSGRFDDPANHPVYGISWRDAAMYVNWLHNDKSTDPSAIMDGAYDVSTFGFVQFEGFTDQLTRHPDARYWIPSLDEWIKAAHYDPNRYGPGEGGYWLYSHTSDEPPIPGLPGVGQTTAGIWSDDEFETPGPEVILPALSLPVGSYTDVMSPWGLLDTSGGAAEWTEEAPIRLGRVVEGTYPGIPFESLDIDSIGERTGARPTSGFNTGLRIAAAVPGPGIVAAPLACVPALLRRRRARGS